MTKKKGLKLGTCNSCGLPIRWMGRYWEHTTGTWRHIAQPKENSNKENGGDKQEEAVPES